MDKSGDGFSVLLVDDDRDTAEMYAMRLRGQGYGVQVAADGLSGLLAARAQRPDLILLDMELPDQYGLQVLRQLKNDIRLAAIPVVVFSNAVEFISAEAIQMGALDCAVKVATPPSLLVELVHGWLPSPSLLPGLSAS